MVYTVLKIGAKAWAVLSPTVVDLDTKLAGTTNPRRLALIVQVLSIRAQHNTSAQSAKLAAAKRLLGAQ